LALRNNQTRKGLITVSASVKMEANMDVLEDDHGKEMLEQVVSNPALQRHTEVMEEGSLSKQELGDGIEGTIPATIGSGGLDAPPEIPQPEVVVATTAITQFNKDMEDVLPPAIEDGALQATLEHAVGILEVTPGDGLGNVAPSSGDDMEIMPSAMTEPRLGKETAPVASPPDSQEKPSIMHDSETGMEVDKVIDDIHGDGRVSSILGTKLDVAASDGDSEALLVESRVNLSRIPNSPESTH
jgi:zinc finger CCCH domain-containing protein 13